MTMRKILMITVAAAMGLSACKSPGKELAGDPPEGPVVESQETNFLRQKVERAVRKEHVREVDALRGISEVEVVESLGEPDETKDFLMQHCCTEFEIELYNTYPPDDQIYDDVEIHQRSWHIDDHILTIWFHQVDGRWSAVDHHLWHEDTEF